MGKAPYTGLLDGRIMVLSMATATALLCLTLLLDKEKCWSWLSLPERDLPRKATVPPSAQAAAPNPLECEKSGRHEQHEAETRRQQELEQSAADAQHQPEQERNSNEEVDKSEIFGETDDDDWLSMAWSPGPEGDYDDEGSEGNEDTEALFQMFLSQNIEADNDEYGEERNARARAIKEHQRLAREAEQRRQDEIASRDQQEAARRDEMVRLSTREVAEKIEAANAALDKHSELKAEAARRLEKAKERRRLAIERASVGCRYQKISVADPQELLSHGRTRKVAEVQDEVRTALEVLDLRSKLIVDHVQRAPDGKTTAVDIPPAHLFQPLLHQQLKC